MVGDIKGDHRWSEMAHHCYGLQKIGLSYSSIRWVCGQPDDAVVLHQVPNGQAVKATDSIWSQRGAESPRVFMESNTDCSALT